MGKKLKKILAISLSLSMLLNCFTVPMSASAAEKEPLQFGSDGKFKILVFSDVQDRYPVYQRVINIMEQALELEQPDLVVFTGDQTEMNTVDPEVDFRRTLEQILQPVVDADVPYAFVFGNHDDQAYESGTRADKDALLSVYQSIGDCRTVDANPELTGTGTCKIPIYASSGNDVAFNLWMVDSNTYYNPEDTSSGYGNPMQDQLAWMAENNDEGINSLVFQHIPMPEIYNLLTEDANGEKTYGDKKYAKTLNANASGYLGEFPCPCNAENNTGEFQTLKKMGNVLGVFTGHDHLNDFTGTYDGIKMTAVPGMTYLNYGDEAVRGYGVIELDEDNLLDYDYNTVKYSTLDEETGTFGETTYDEYDEITYSDLKMNGQALSSTSYTISDGHTFTYDATSPSKSAIFKFRWTAGSNPGFQFSFDEGENGNIANPFGVWIKRAEQAEPNGAWHLKPNVNSQINMDSKVSQGDTFDIEFGRLKILTGAPQYVGQYYVYLKVNGELIQDGYSNVDEEGNYISGKATVCQVSNVIRFGGWGNGGDDKISEYVETPTEEYMAYDIVGLKDLGITDSTISKGEYSYAGTSPTYSVIFKFGWEANVTDKDFKIALDREWNNAFTIQFSSDVIRSYLGYGSESGDREKITPAITTGSHEVEIGRLRVKTGENAGKDYVYLKVDGTIIDENYTNWYQTEGGYESGYGTTTLAYKICFPTEGTADQKFYEVLTEEPDEEPESPYYAYDIVGLKDLGITDSTISKGEYSYAGTSPTYSVIFKFGWEANVTDKDFKIALDREWNNAFTIQFSSDVIRSYLGYGSESGDREKITPAITTGSHEVEIGRLRVKTGENAGKDYVYLKVDGTIIDENYTNWYQTEGGYESGYGTTTLAYKICFPTEGTADQKFYEVLTEEPDEEPESPYYDYDEITYSDLKEDDNFISSDGMNISGSKEFTYDVTSPTYSAIFKFRWTVGTVAELQFSFDMDNSGMSAFSTWFRPAPNDSEYGGIRIMQNSTSKIKYLLTQEIKQGETHDIEFARLKVKDGENAGKYYVYLKVDDELIGEGYLDVDENGTYLTDNSETQLSNVIYFYSNDYDIDNAISAIPAVEAYEDYDEVGFSDLRDADGNALEGQKLMSGATVLTYDKTSATSSVIFKYRWKVGDIAKFQMSFDKVSSETMSYMFGVWLEETDSYPNGRMWLRPAYGPEVGLATALVPGTSHNIEFARLKVASGENAGKYHVYIKIDDVLIAEDYVAADVVNANDVYTTDPDATEVALSNEIFFAFWGSEGNSIMAYREVGSNKYDGTRGDFNSDGIINEVDLKTLRKYLVGIDVGDMPDGIGDMNVDDETNVLDLIVMKKHLVILNDYTRTGSITLGTQEHLNEDESKTAEYIADASATLGASAYRLSMPIHQLYYANSANEAVVREDNMGTFKGMVKALKEQGITEILYVTDSFILPYGYADNTMNHNKTVPDPKTDTGNYVAWLTVNAEAFKKLAEEVPEIKFFEPYNEINLKTTRLERYGCAWDTTSDVQATYKFTLQEKAGIMADLCWYVSRAVKSVSTNNQVTTPSIIVGSNSIIENDFVEAFYDAIESGAYPSNQSLTDKRVDNYFTIVNIHAYPDYTENDAWFGDNFESNANDEITEWAGYISAAYDVVRAHNDGSSRVWLTETGMSSYDPDGELRSESNVERIIELALKKLDEELTFVETVYFYEIADMSSDKYDTPSSETHFGLFYAYDDLDAPYAAKSSAKVIYRFFHNGATDYSQLDALAKRYAE